LLPPLTKYLVVAQTDTANLQVLVLDTEETTGTQNVFSVISDYSTDENTILNLTAAGDLKIDGALTTGGASTVYGDNFISFGGSPQISFSDTGSLTIKDSAGNTLFSLSDSGTYGTLTINTISPTTINAFTLGGNITAAGYDITGLGTLSATTLTDGTLTISSGAISGGTTATFSTSVTTPLVTNSTLTLESTGGILTLQTSATADADDIIFKPAGAEKLRIKENGDLFFEKGTYDTTLTITSPTANRTITFPDASGTVAISATSPITLSSTGDIGLTTPLATTYGGTGLSSIGTANQILGVNSTEDGLEYKTLQGTTNQITVSHSAGAITLSLPQDIATSSSPTFSGLTLSSLTEGSILFTGSSGIISEDNSNLYFDNTNKRVGIGTTTPQSKLDIRGDLLIPAADVVVDCDGSSSTGSGTCDSISDGTTLVSMGSDKLDFDNDGAADGQPLCTDSLTSPTIVAKDNDNDCSNGAGGTAILGTPDGTETITVGSSWAFKDDDGDSLLDDGEELYIDNFPATKYFASGTGNAYFGRVGIGTESPNGILHIDRSDSRDVYIRIQNENDDSWTFGAFDFVMNLRAAPVCSAFCKLVISNPLKSIEDSE